MPKISVVMPIYNVEAYLEKCLESILSQTLHDFEILAVDDGSTDSSATILNEYATRDSRVHVIRQMNAGAGIARNTGMRVATGEYLLFLDGDDWFEPDFFFRLLSKAQKDSAEITVCRFDMFDSSTSFIKDIFFFHQKLLLLKCPFSLKDTPDQCLLELFPAAPWCSLFSAKYIHEHHFEFQDLPRTNDLYFVYSAFFFANRISLVNKVLVHYRIGMTTNLQSGNSKTPFAFFKALLALKNNLIRNDLYNMYEKSFLSMSLQISFYNLQTQNKIKSFESLYFVLKQHFLDELGCMNYGKEFYLPETYQRLEQLQLSQNPCDYLLRENLRLRNLNGSLFIQIRENFAKQELIMDSRAYRLGRFITRLFSPFICLYENGFLYTLKKIKNSLFFMRKKT